MDKLKHARLLGSAGFLLSAFLMSAQTAWSSAAAAAVAGRRADAPVVVAQYDGGPDDYGPEMGPYGGYGAPGDGPGGYAGRRSYGVRRTVSYHGFRVVFTGPQGEADLAAVEHQIDMVDSAGMSTSDMQLFRGRTIEATGQGSSESQRGTSVVLGNLRGADSRPILLHEYMHILHRSRMPGGFNNATIKAFYAEARSMNLFPADAYMMSNVREFFAVTASCYLNGTVERPPYNRETIRQQQPGYYAFLSRLFGH